MLYFFKLACKALCFEVKVFSFRSNIYNSSIDETFHITKHELFEQRFIKLKGEYICNSRC